MVWWQRWAEGLAINIVSNTVFLLVTTYVVYRTVLPSNFKYQFLVSTSLRYTTESGHKKLNKLVWFVFTLCIIAFIPVFGIPLLAVHVFWIDPFFLKVYILIYYPFILLGIYYIYADNLSNKIIKHNEGRYFPERKYKDCKNKSLRELEALTYRWYEHDVYDFIFLMD
jgi:hypothetical protein